MNKLLLTTLGMVAAVSAAYAQGTFNANNNFVPAGASAKAFILGTDGNALAKANGRVEILEGSTTLSPNGSAGVALTLDGLFFINGLASGSAGLGGTANLVVRAWDVTSGATYDTALVRGAVNVVVSSLGGGTTPPATFGNNSDFKGLSVSVIPEPSTVAFAALGVAGLFVVARRKA
ncbi:MAG: PEP-CTERM sorting domain-containing protein [Verrucomicrobia bacterium]|nr:PEP-CTERM sorting domain-containing protein [Verrucomicrobiota bacterium]